MNTQTRVICSGMPRSGSTWSYNACRLLLGNPPYGYVGSGTDGDAVDNDMRQFMSDNPESFCVKCHYPGPWTLSKIQSGDLFNVFTFRDPRDAVLSRMDAFDVSFEEAMADLEISHSYLDTMIASRTFFLNFTSIVYRPQCAVFEIAHRLGVQVLHEEVSTIVAELSIRRTQKRIESELEFDPTFHHNKTWLYHRTHIGKCTTGGWKDRLTPEQTAHVKDRLNGWFRFFGYE